MLCKMLGLGFGLGFILLYAQFFPKAASQFPFVPHHHMSHERTLWSRLFSQYYLWCVLRTDIQSAGLFQITFCLCWVEE